MRSRTPSVPRTRSPASRLVWAAGLAALILPAGCDGEPLSDAGPPDAGPATAAPLVDYAADDDLYAAPWPDERLRGGDGRVSVAAFPNARGVPIVTQLLDLLEGAEGFGVSSTLYFPLAGPVDAASLPDVHGSVAEDASVFVMDVDPDSPDRGTRAPVDVSFQADPGPFGTPDLLGLLPLQGRPLEADRLYAAVLTTAVRGVDGAPLEVAPATAALLAGERPDGLSDAAFEAHQRAIEGLRAAGVDDARVAATAVFRTWDPTAALRRAADQVLAEPAPTPAPDVEAHEVFDDYCVFRTTVDMPDFQAGEAPYESEGGAWAVDADGSLEVQRQAESNVWITVPRRAMPEGGFPTAVFVRTGGGGDRPLIDRGPRSEPGGMADEPGTGPAQLFARAGFAGVQVDGPLGGLRNLGGWDEQFAIFNINNPAGLRDNIRQSALELILFPRILEALRVDASSCPGFTAPAGDGEAFLDADALALMGHSMGATIAPLTAALEPRYRALLLSGAGGSWIMNVVYKEAPIHVRPAADALLRYAAQGRTVNAFDPALALLQWAGEPADPQVYARHVVDAPLAGEPRHVLMFQGILDTYIPPPIANALSLAFPLDLAGGALDARVSDRYRSLVDTLDLAGTARVELPAQGNRGDVTAVVVQHEEDGIEDGHEVVFQTAGPRLQYRCFLESWRAGVPRVPTRDAAGCD
ncbi:MAG TPA: hypothetical protein RMH99_04025 [Sandaracinaceae bacterium LLY-WYZ-13_1]|nr:hypothetical protein [Sandaracinaceae bacterium LLY-WYZ-13_1]